jgi:predicted nuclease with TOPRIM domain
MANQMKDLRVDCEELRQNLEDEKVRCAQVVKESEARCREVEEYKSRVSELEEKMHDSGEVIYFAPEECSRQKVSIRSLQFIF